MAPISDNPTVISPDGVRGYIEPQDTEQMDDNTQVLVNFDNGQRLWVPPEALLLQEDGCYQLQIPLSELGVQHTRPTIYSRPPDLEQRLAAAGVEMTRPTPAAAMAVPDVPVPAAPADVPTTTDSVQSDSDAPVTTNRLRVAKVVQAFHEEITEPILQDDVRIHRVPVNEYVNEPPPIRYENDQVIIPITEEVLVVEKRLLVREELVVTKRQVASQAREQAVRKREDAFAYPAHSGATADHLAEAGEESFQDHYATHYGQDAQAFEYYQPAYRFGRSLKRAQRGQQPRWDDVAQQAQELWEALNPGTWDDVRSAVEHGFADAGVAGANAI